MKKSFLLFFVISIIVGCSPNNKLQVSTLSVSKEQKNSEEKKYSEINDQQKLDIKNSSINLINNCEEKVEKGMYESKNECLYYSIYYEVYNSKDNIILCETINKENEYYSKCLWHFAMNYKDEKICDQLKYSETFESKFLNPEDCKLELNYKTANSNWKLKNGIPYLADAGPQYEGEATIKGWIVEFEYYNTPTKFFKVSEESIKDLPESFHDPNFQEYGLEIIGDDSIEKEVWKSLEDYNEKNPAIIKVNSIKTKWEAVPSLGFVEIINF